MASNAEKPIIIEQPALQTWPQRLGFFILTVLLWAFWIYLWLPLLSPWEERLGITDIIDTHVFTREEYSFILIMIVVVAVASIIISIVLGLWAYYNIKRFRHNRRRRPNTLDSDRVADFFLVDSREIETWHQAKRMNIAYSKEGKVDIVEVLEGGPPTQAQLPLSPN